MNTTFIIQTFFDFDRPDLILERQWVEGRFEFFNRFTLPSLLNQSFQDFRIFMLCGLRNRDLTMKFPWHPKIEICYNKGREKYKKINTDYVAIFRIDSDDMLHKEGMAEIRDNLMLSDKRECLIFRKNLAWAPINRFMKPHYRTSPPAFIHIFPREIYKDWELFCSQHFQQHSRAGGNLPTTKELSKHKVCIVKHPGNISKVKREITMPIFDENQRQVLATNDDMVILDRDKIVSILRDFAVEEKWVK